MAVGNSTVLLGCGRSIDGVWAGLGRPPDRHSQGCRHCQRARATLAPLAAATASLRHSDRTAPVPPPGLKRAVLKVARAEVRRGLRMVLREGARGQVEVSEQAVASVVRRAAAEIPGVRARRCRIDVLPRDDDGVEPGVELRIFLRTAASPAVNIESTMERVRQRIMDAVAEGIGVEARTVHLTVEDLYDD